MKLKRRTQQSLDGELGLIIDDMSRAMWAAERAYIAKIDLDKEPITLHMSSVLENFRVFCRKYYGK